MSEELLAEQIAYYRRRAPEYDATAYGDDPGAEPRIERIVAALPPAERTLELACGTGRWTRALAARPGELVAVDASPETIAIARQRCGPAVRFVSADVLRWTPRRKFDLIFFAFWLSHVPVALRAPFFARLESMLTPGATVAFVDEHVNAAESEVALAGEVARRELRDGSSYQLVKVFLDPPALEAELAAAGWRAQVNADGHDWVVGTASR